MGLLTEEDLHCFTVMKIRKSDPQKAALMLAFAVLMTPTYVKL